MYCPVNFEERRLLALAGMKSGCNYWSYLWVTFTSAYVSVIEHQLARHPLGPLVGRLGVRKRSPPIRGRVACGQPFPVLERWLRARRRRLIGM